MKALNTFHVNLRTVTGDTILRTVKGDINLRTVTGDTILRTYR